MVNIFRKSRQFLAQSMVEYTILIALVAAGIIMMNKYVFRGVWAGFKMWEDQVADSMIPPVSDSDDGASSLFGSCDSNGFCDYPAENCASCSNDCISSVTGQCKYIAISGFITETGQGAHLVDFNTAIPNTSTWCCDYPYLFSLGYWNYLQGQGTPWALNPGTTYLECRLGVDGNAVNSALESKCCYDFHWRTEGGSWQSHPFSIVKDTPSCSNCSSGQGCGL